MSSILNKNIIVATMITLMMGMIIVPVNAQCAGAWLPDVIQEYVCNPNPENFAEARVRSLFMLAIGVIILFAIAMGIKASFQLIASGGRDDKKEEAFNGIKGIFMGIAFLFIIMMAIPIVLNFFGFNFQDMVSGVTICIKAPESAGCYACTHKDLEEGDVSNAEICSKCDTNYEAPISYPVTENGTLKGTTTCTESMPENV